MANILEVKNLKVSFRTSGGTLKAVRDISFNLERGKTLAIVGESGSGKSVTSRSILGILAGNAIVDGGEILYDGKDLLKIPEEEMCKIRGDKISMVFQDPLSSLNPIVKIGRQITEAMLLKNKGNRRRARKAFKTMLADLRKNMTEAKPGDEAKIVGMTKSFERFNMSAQKDETAYNTAFSYADELHENIGDFLFLQEKGQKVNVKLELKECATKLRRTKNRFLTKGNIEDLPKTEDKPNNGRGAETADAAVIPVTLGNGSINDYIDKLVDELRSARITYRVAGKDKSSVIPTIRDVLERVRLLMGGLVARETPDFLSICYYEYKHSAQDLEKLSTAEANKTASECLNREFLNEFIEYSEEAIRYSHNKALEKKKEILPDLDNGKTYYAGDFTKSAAKSYGKKMAAGVEKSIDTLEIVKDSYAYTFRSSLMHAIDQYFYFKKLNPKEEARFARQTRKREAMIARGKTVDWKVVPKRVRDLDELKDEILKVVKTQDERYHEYIDKDTNGDAAARAQETIGWFREQASQAVYRINKSIAKEKAIRLMKEVGIAEPRIRYNQYPFEFSGGMRQRIVIAIALAANPDILICDEPTTALDVTIQSQILELINKLKAERNLSVVFITHDLGVVANMADDIAVMYAGKIVEYGTADDVFYDPRHPYTWALLSSMPDLDTKEKLDAIPGTPPNMIYPPEGDAFAARNKYAMQIDYEEQPPQYAISDTHWAATWLLHPDAPKVDIPKAISDRIERMKKKNETTA